MAKKGKQSNFGLSIVVIIVIFGFFIIQKNCEKDSSQSESSETNTSTQSTTSQNEEVKSKLMSHPYDKDNNYILQFSDDFNSVMNAVDDLGLSVVIAVDCSGSMNRYPADGPEIEKYIQAAKALNQIALFLRDFYRSQNKGEALVLKVGIIGFSTKIKTIMPLTEMNEEAFTQFIAITEKAENFSPSGDTAIGSALEVGSEALAQSGTIFKSLIVVSDGENNRGINPDLVLSALIENRNNYTSEDNPVYTNNILVNFVGFDIGTSTFSKLEEIGASVLSAANEAELNAVLKKIFIADIKNLEAK